MHRKKGLAMAAAALSLALLAGCGSKESADSGAAGAGNGNAGAQQQGQQQAPGGGQGAGGFAQIDLMGKVKSIDGNTITVYKASFTPGQGGMGGGRGQRPSVDGGTPPAKGLAPQGDQPADGGQQLPGEGNGQQPGNRGGGEGMNFENMFTDETEDVIVTDATKIVKREFVDNQMQETELTLADLKADDILTVKLKDGTQEAETIAVGMGGGFGGMGGGGFGRGGQRGQGTQSQDQSPAQ